ncbi:MAG: ribosomal-protein-alanine N-acetyltransferase [Candidatus Muproteobacteria bacterium RBG_16_60_9]|uniref:[Ribosomal protein bS18]-alanine N-acetyltransferase n=1 Tax=Candidatus Muproteobacteria bacterium RBG_16_60_9 TaxID=1817755 RepID=A0A1F6UZX1_9PROT|nr:MAG: ribosomal-protein-alanine N-acetyltransferase [Candidatus Muproteobacteria bacterium RBG_16_60_9]
MSAAVIAPERPRLRPMREVDLNAVLEVERSSYEFPWTRAIFRDCLRAGYYCFVYESSAGLVGHGIVSIAAGECHLLNICVHPEYQRRGLGRALVNFLLLFARRKRAKVALLEVRISNPSAYQLYIQLGFDEIGMRKDYYPARYGREDAIILARDLTIDSIPPPRSSSGSR